MDFTPYVEAGGVVRARTTALIASRVMAPILAVHAVAGERVRRGAVLVTLDAREMTSRAAGATASLTAAVEGAKATATDAAAAEAALKLARATHARIRDLHASRSATTQELDQATSALEAADAQAASARARTVAAGAAREAATAAADAAAIGVSYTVLTAPFDGVVTERAADPGSMAVPGAPLLIVEDTTTLRLDVELDDTRAGGLGVGRPIDVRLDGSDEGWQQATVAEVGRSDPASHSFVAKVALPRGTSARPGSFGRVRVAGPARRTLSVASASIVRRGQLTLVFTIADGAAHLRPVVPGAEADGRTEVLAGVRAGDTVVTSPPPALTDGTRVTMAASGGSR
jgi:multidrug efflux pump subunit AcrA (membrane-fusion protein)